MNSYASQNDYKTLRPPAGNVSNLQQQRSVQQLPNTLSQAGMQTLDALQRQVSPSPQAFNRSNTSEGVQQQQQQQPSRRYQFNHKHLQINPLTYENQLVDYHKQAYAPDLSPVAPSLAIDDPNDRLNKIALFKQLHNQQDIYKSADFNAIDLQEQKRVEMIQQYNQQKNKEAKRNVQAALKADYDQSIQLHKYRTLEQKRREQEQEQMRIRNAQLSLQQERERSLQAREMRFQDQAAQATESIQRLRNNNEMNKQEKLQDLANIKHYIDNETKKEEAYHSHFTKWSDSMEMRNQLYKKLVLEDKLQKQQIDDARHLMKSDNSLKDNAMHSQMKMRQYDQMLFDKPSININQRKAETIVKNPQANANQDINIIRSTSLLSNGANINRQQFNYHTQSNNTPTNQNQNNQVNSGEGFAKPNFEPVSIKPQQIKISSRAQRPDQFLLNQNEVQNQGVFNEKRYSQLNPLTQSYDSRSLTSMAQQNQRSIITPNTKNFARYQKNPIV